MMKPMLPAMVAARDRAMLRLAREASSNSPAGCMNVGAVICDARGNVRTVTWDQFPRGLEDVAANRQRDLRYPLSCHAETNAIQDAVGPVEACTLYVFPVPPCGDCVKAMLRAGITRVVAIEQPQEGGGFSRISPPASVMFAEAKVPYITYKREDLDPAGGGK